MIAAMTKAVPGAVGSRAALLLRDVLRNQSRASPAAVARVARLLEQVGGGRHGGDVSRGSAAARSAAGAGAPGAQAILSGPLRPGAPAEP